MLSKLFNISTLTTPIILSSLDTFYTYSGTVRLEPPDLLLTLQAPIFVSLLFISTGWPELDHGSLLQPKLAQITITNRITNIILNLNPQMNLHNFFYFVQLTCINNTQFTHLQW